jgi:hypothetical protein
MGLSWQQGPLAPGAIGQHIDLPGYASDLRGRIAFAWPAMDAFYEEDERIMGHAADSYHYYDIGDARLAAWPGSRT